MFERQDRVNEPLHVITPIYNPTRWRSRWKLFEDFAKRCKEAGAVLHVIEAAFGNREPVLHPYDQARKLHQDHDYDYDLVRVKHELWLKENLINVEVSKLPTDWKYVAWIDADVTFARDDWANETLHQLQHYDVVQMYSQFQDLSPTHEVLGTWRSFMDCYLNGGEVSYEDFYYYSHKRVGYPGAPGLAWAARRDAWNSLGGLIDWTILGAGDWYMAHALVGALDTIINRPGRHKGAEFTSAMQAWQARAERFIRRNVGMVEGLALHDWHGRKKNRKYVSRDRILVDAQFNPLIDLKRDSQLVYQLNDDGSQRSIELRDRIRQYFRQRNEDGTDV